MHLFWQVWLAGVAITLAAAEGYALATGKETLSAFVREVTAEAPIFRDGTLVTVGWLIGHFWEIGK